MTTYPIADLHSHYPMHLRSPDVYDHSMSTLRGVLANDVAGATRGLLLKFARRFFSDDSPESGPSISLPRYRHGGVEVAFSPLYSPFDELFAKGRFLGPPVSDDYATLVDQMDRVETSLRAPGARATVARSMADVASARAAGKVAIVHAIEGGFHLGANEAEIDARVAALRARGVAYVTVAHLFYRGLARNAAALPFLPDRVYHSLFRMPDVGLTPLGEALVRSLHRHRVLIDVTHMAERTMRDTFELLDDLDGSGPKTPVIASHGACRFGDLEYNLSDEMILKIAERDGAIGMIACDHYIGDGVLDAKSRTFEDSLAAMVRHVRHVHAVTTTHDHAALGTDHDGFIKPTLVGIENPARLQRLVHGLAASFDESVAKRIASENALRVLARVF